MFKFKRRYKEVGQNKFKRKDKEENIFTRIKSGRAIAEINPTARKIKVVKGYFRQIRKEYFPEYKYFVIVEELHGQQVQKKQQI